MLKSVTPKLVVGGQAFGWRGKSAGSRTVISSGNPWIDDDDRSLKPIQILVALYQNFGYIIKAQRKKAVQAPQNKPFRMLLDQ